MEEYASREIQIFQSVNKKYIIDPRRFVYKWNRELLYGTAWICGTRLCNGRIISRNNIFNLTVSHHVNCTAYEINIEILRFRGALDEEWVNKLNRKTVDDIYHELQSLYPRAGRFITRASAASRSNAPKDDARSRRFDDLKIVTTIRFDDVKELYTVHAILSKKV